MSWADGHSAGAHAWPSSWADVTVLGHPGVQDLSSGARKGGPDTQGPAQHFHRRAHRQRWWHCALIEQCGGASPQLRFSGRWWSESLDTTHRRPEWFSHPFTWQVTPVGDVPLPGLLTCDGA